MNTRPTPLAARIRRPLLAGLIALGSALITPAIHAQTQFAGTYTGTINKRITPASGAPTESILNDYSAVVSATGAVSINGGNPLGTVSAAGTVTLTGGPAFDNLAITTATIAPGNFTGYRNKVGSTFEFSVTGNAHSAGVVLVEVYDLGNVSGGSKLTNVSILSRAGTGSSTPILRGTGQRTLLVRGVGPTLAAAPFNIGGTLADPKLTIVDGNQREVVSNLDCGQADYLSELVLATNFVGACSLQD